MGVLLLSYIPPMPTLASSTLVNCIDKVDKLYFKRETGVKPNINKAVNKVPLY